MSYKENLRPQIHFSPEKNWLNDPNGCVYHNGIYHLFYQFHPFSTQWGPMHWGHAESRDLVHWEEKDIALYPDEETGMAFSGSGVVDKGNTSGLFSDDSGLAFFYTCHREEPGKETVQHQCLAISHDGGGTLKKYPGNPILHNPGVKDFRDPKVFYHNETEKWIMVLAVGERINIYNSSNLIKWQEISCFTREMGDLSGIWECPDLFSLTDSTTGKKHWVLAFSILMKPAHPTQLYLIGSFDGYRFQAYDPETIGIADYGYDFYAAQSWSNLPFKDDRKVWIGWASNWNYAHKTPDSAGWRGVMSLPREITILEKDGRFILNQSITPFLADLRPDKPFLDLLSVTDDQSYELKEAAAWEIMLEIFSEGREKSAELTFHWDCGDSLVLTVSKDHFMLDRGNCGSIFRQVPWDKIEAPLAGTEEFFFCQIILDNSIVEIFLNEGMQALTNLIFPEGKLIKLDISPAPGCRIGNIKGFPLQSIWRGK